MLTKTYSISDYWKYSATGTVQGSSTLTFCPLADLNGLSDYEISINLKSNIDNAFDLSIHQANNSDNTYLVRAGADSIRSKSCVSILSVKSENSVWGTYSANNVLPVKFKMQNGTLTAYVENNSYTFNNPPSNLRYVGLESWNSNKTITYTDLIIKQL